MKNIKTKMNEFLNESMEPHKELIFVPEEYENLR